MDFNTVNPPYPESNIPIGEFMAKKKPKWAFYDLFTCNSNP